MAGKMGDGDKEMDGDGNGKESLGRDAIGFCAGLNAGIFCSDRDLEQMSLLMSDVLHSRSPDEFIQSHLINLEILKKLHVDRLEVFDALYKWNPVSGTSLSQLLNYGGDIVLTPSNTIDIKTMAETPGEVFNDKYLLCRTVTPALKMFAIHIVVQDTNNNGARLVLSGIQSLYPFYPNIIPVGTILVIKNPAFHCTADTDIGFSLLVMDKASIFYLNDVDFSWMESAQPSCSACRCSNHDVICSQWDPNNVPSFPFTYKQGCINIYPAPSHAREWKRVAERFMETGDLHSAVDAYTRALHMTPKDVKLIQLRCMALRGLKSFYLALADAEAMIALEPKNMLGVNLKAQCLMSLERYQDAVNYLKGKIKASKIHLGELTETLDEAQELNDQHKFGKYNMSKIMMCITHRMTLAEYTGPLEYRLGPTGMHGVLATKAIPRGSLILVKKALVACVGDDSATWPTGQLIYTEVLSRAILLHNIEYLLTCFPEKAHEYYTLEEKTDNETRDILDIERMCEVMYRKAFLGVDGFHPGPSLQNSGVFLGFAPSFRHRCVDTNCSWQIYGDYLMIRTYRDVKKGEELFLTRIDPKHSYDMRMKKFEDWNITCDCRLCKVDQADGPDIRKNRELILVNIRKMLSGGLSRLDTIKLEEQLSEYRALRKEAPDLNTRLFGAIDAIAKAYFCKGKVIKALEFLEEIRPHLMSVGCSLEFVGCTLGIITCYEALGQGTKSKEWNAQMRKELEILLGGSGEKMLETLLYNRAFKKFKMVSIGIGFGIQL